MDREERPNAIRRVYGRGLLDGLALAGIENPRDYMNTNKLLEAERSLNGMATKVLNAVPIGEAWTPGQICGELKRIGGNPDMRVITGCLNTLKTQGLIKEPEAGTFQRVKITIRTPAVKLVRDEPAPAAAPATPAQAEADTMDKIGAIAAGLRALAHQANQIADQIDTVAVEVEERFEKERASSAGLRELQSVLRKSLGVSA